MPIYSFSFQAAMHVLHGFTSQFRFHKSVVNLRERVFSNYVHCAYDRALYTQLLGMLVIGLLTY